MNKVVLIGRLTYDPEARTTNSNKVVTSFRLAVDREYLGKDKKKQLQETGGQTADFIKVEAWEGLAKACADNLTKGQRVAVYGRLANEQYETEIDGTKCIVRENIVRASEVEFLDKPTGSAIGSSQEEENIGDIFSGEDFPF